MHYMRAHGHVKSSPFRWVPDKLVSVQARENFDFGVPGNTLVVKNLKKNSEAHCSHPGVCVPTKKEGIEAILFLATYPVPPLVRGII